MWLCECVPWPTPAPLRTAMYDADIVDLRVTKLTRRWGAEERDSYVVSSVRGKAWKHLGCLIGRDGSSG